MERLKRKEKCQLTEKFLQFGEGNFLRGFVDWMIDRLNKEADFDGGVVVVQPLAHFPSPVIGRSCKYNKGKGIYLFFIYQDVQFHQVALLISQHFIVKRSIAS